MRNFYGDIKSKISIVIFGLFFVLCFSGCLQTKESAKAVSASSSWFAGAALAANVGGYPTSVKVTWARADRSVTGYRVYSLRPNATTGVNEWTNIAQVDDSQTSYVDTQNLSDGTVYTYKVQAIDALTGSEDGNSKQVSTVTFYGISGVAITGKTTATIALSGLSGAYDAIHIYATPTGGSKTLLATVKGNPASVDITGLRSGVNYKFTANAYMTYLSAEDGNTRTVNGETWSDSFGSGLTADTTYFYRGILNVQGYGLAPNATAGPTGRQINLIWLPFSNSSSSTKYKVVRSTTTSIDTTVSTACTSTSTTSCMVCTVTGAQKCIDTNVSAPPQTYYYAITQMKTDTSGVEYTEELPCLNGTGSGTNICSPTDFIVTAHVPPDYMVLVQRDAANYEMCLNINATSDPRHKQRCIYTGLGAVPSTTGPGKPAKTYDSGYYDFGYNLFVDRYKMACNWTRNSSTCGPNGCVGVLSTSGSPVPPDASLGNTGDVFYGFQYASSADTCYIKTTGLNGSSGWISLSSANLSSSDLATMTTNDPGTDKHQPAIGYFSPEQASNICQAHSTDYGSKRLLRRREYLAASPLPYISGEDNAYVSGLRVFDAPQFTGVCNGFTTDIASGATASEAIANWLGSSIIRNIITVNSVNLGNEANHYYMIGNRSSTLCTSRFGIQDPFGFGLSGIPVSDTFTKTSGTTFPMTLQASPSPYDSGNLDFSNFSFNGTLGPNQGVVSGGWYYFVLASYRGGATTGYPCNSSKELASFIPSLGIPICTWSGGAQTLRSLPEFQSTGSVGGAPLGLSGVYHVGYIPTSTGPTGNSYVMTVGSSSSNAGRWSFGFTPSGIAYSNYSTSLLCGIEAE